MKINIHTHLPQKYFQFSYLTYRVLYIRTCLMIFFNHCTKREWYLDVSSFLSIGSDFAFLSSICGVNTFITDYSSLTRNSHHLDNIFVTNRTRSTMLSVTKFSLTWRHFRFSGNGHFVVWGMTYFTINSDRDSDIIFFSFMICSCCRVSTMWCFLSCFRAYVLLESSFTWTWD